MIYTKNDIIKIFHEEYKISCAKADITSLKTKVEELINRIHKLENPPKKLNKIELELNLCSYRDKTTGRLEHKESEKLIELKYKLLQLRKSHKND